MVNGEQNRCGFLTESLFDGVYYVDGNRRITYWNPAAEEITGYAGAEVLGRRCSDNMLVHVDETGCCLCDGQCALARAMGEGEYCEREVYLRHREGHRVPVQMRAKPLTDSGGRVVGAVAIFRENRSGSAMHQMVEELRRLALLDTLTGLPNRRYLERALHAKLDELHRYGQPFGALFVDVDDFKQVNDSLGHDVGDEVLRMVGRTLAHSIRSFDLVGRWGGEEFIAVVVNVTGDELSRVAQKLRALVEQSQLTAGAGSVHVTVSIGAAMAGEDDTAEMLVAKVDKLMYESKARGKNRVTIALGQETGKD